MFGLQKDGLSKKYNAQLYCFLIGINLIFVESHYIDESDYELVSKFFVFFLEKVLLDYLF